MRDQGQTLNHGLRHEHSVERILMLGRERSEVRPVAIPKGQFCLPP